MPSDGKKPFLSVTPTRPHDSGKGNRRDYDINCMADILAYAKMLQVKSAADITTHCFIERSQAMPGQGSVSMFSTGYGYGIWLGLLTALQIEYSTIPSQRWSKYMLAEVNGGTTKQAASVVAHHLFPTTNFLASERCRVDHDGLVDAALIAEYGRRQFIAENK